MKPTALCIQKPEETHGFPEQNPQAKPDETLAFAFAFATADQIPRSRTTAPVGAVRPRSVEKSVENRKLISFAQLCAVAKDQFDSHSLGEWMERVKCRCATMGYRYSPIDVCRACVAVQHAHRLTFAPKQASGPVHPEPAYRELSAIDASAALSRIFAEIKKRHPLTPTGFIAPVVNHIARLLRDILAGERLTVGNWKETRALLMVRCHQQGVTCDETATTKAMQFIFDQQGRETVAS